MPARAAIVVLGAIVAGCAGPPGPPGPAGGGGGYEIVVGETVLDASVTKQLRVDCPDGKRTTGAGWSVLDETSAILTGRATYSEPAFDGSHWLANASLDGRPPGTPWKLRLRVICASIAD